MDNPVKMATQGTQDDEKQNNTQRNITDVGCWLLDKKKLIVPQLCVVHKRNEKLEDTEGVIRSRQSNNSRKYHDQKKREKRQLSTKHYAKD